MSLIKDIKSDQLYSRKNKQASNATLLTTLIGEAEMIGKNNGNRETTDAEVVAVIKKFIKNNQELMSVVNPESSGFNDAKIENDILTNYLPTQLTETELRSVVQKRIATLENISPKIMGKIMAWLKETYNGQYDGRMASTIVKELLS